MPVKTTGSCTMAHGVKLDGLSLEDLTALIADAQKALATKVDAKRQELQKQLAELDAISKPSKAATAGRQRNPSSYTHVHPKNGHEWLGRGGVPQQWQDIVSKDDVPEVRREKIRPYRKEL
jgi:DNA-binding protein H-NS